ncbi:MAG: hypothetical protein JW772_04670 [Candidatus Diapherotrites archaeon]|nr:hypothetical protein [Candidatus Diapherotrites archaeon]
MPAKPLKGPFSDYFYARLRRAKIKPRRMINPRGIESHTWAVSNIRRKWARDLYYDARALRNLDHAIRLVPSIEAHLKRSFDYVLTHERAHTGTTFHTPYTAKKIKRLAYARGTPEKAQLIAEQVANRGVLARILREANAKTFASKKAHARVIDVLTWDLINASIRTGEFKKILRNGLDNVTASEERARRQNVMGMLQMLYPDLPAKIIHSTLNNFGKVYGKIIDEAEAAQKSRKRQRSKRTLRKHK